MGFAPPDEHQVVVTLKVMGSFQPRPSTLESVRRSARSMFPRYGPIYRVTELPKERGGVFFAHYFSKHDALAAKKDLDGTLVENMTLETRMGNDRGYRRGDPMSVASCFKLANGFAGFNRWRSSVASIVPYDGSLAAHRASIKIMSSQASTQNRFIFVATVTIYVGESFHMDGEGAGSGDDFGRAKKSAVSNAYRIAFANCALLNHRPSGSLYVTDISSIREPFKDDDRDCEGRKLCWFRSPLHRVR